MKRKVLQYALGLFLIFNGASAQSWSGSDLNVDSYRNGNVGIGTSTPASKLHINLYNASAPQYGLLLSTNTFGTGAIAQNSYFLKTLDQGNGAVTFIVKGNGVVGINNDNPQYPLDVTGDIHTTGSLDIDGGDLFLARTNNDYGFIVRPASKPNLAFATSGGGTLDVVSVNSKLSYFSGNIGIGTTALGAYKLAVEGKIAARGIKVTLGSFADYVFEPTYKLRPLAHLEQYINQNKHLPGIPSEEEVKKDGGIELGEMNVKLLEKIEELSLYIIEMNKKLEEQQKEIERMKKHNSK